MGKVVGRDETRERIKRQVKRKKCDRKDKEGEWRDYTGAKQKGEEEIR